jgi:hypothetical protein
MGIKNKVTLQQCLGEFLLGSGELLFKFTNPARLFDRHPFSLGDGLDTALPVTALQLHAPFIDLAAFQTLAPGQLLRWDHPSQILLDNTTFVIKFVLLSLLLHTGFSFSMNHREKPVRTLRDKLRLFSQPPAFHDPSRALIHSSGLHGVEGFAGSAIRLALLEQLPSISSDGAILVLHALNPYGMAWFRHVNVNNVNLNRNFITSEEQRTGSVS